MRSGDTLGFLMWMIVVTIMVVTVAIVLAGVLLEKKGSAPCAESVHGCCSSKK